MGETFKSRVAVAKKILDHPWVKAALSTWTVIATYDVFSDQLLPESVARKAPKVREIISMTSGFLPWWGWALVLAAILVAASLEYAFKRTPSLQAAGARPKTTRELRSRPETGLPKIEIHFEKREPYEVTNVEHHHVKSTVCVGIKNTGGGALSNCKVYIQRMVPTWAIPGDFPILLNSEPFLLRNDDPPRLVEIASQWNHVEEFRFSAPMAGGFFREAYGYMPSRPSRTIIIKVEATECQRSATFRLSIDDSKRVHLEFVSYVN